jgi:hypothetical protein
MYLLLSTWRRNKVSFLERVAVKRNHALRVRQTSRDERPNLPSQFALVKISLFYSKISQLTWTRITVQCACTYYRVFKAVRACKNLTLLLKNLTDHQNTYYRTVCMHVLSGVQSAGWWTPTHTSHKDTEQSTTEASITLDGVTLTDSLIGWSPNEWPSVCREIPVSADKMFWTSNKPAQWIIYIFILFVVSSLCFQSSVQ